jgi:hypothetical protein
MKLRLRHYLVITLIQRRDYISVSASKIQFEELTDWALNLWKNEMA